MITTVDDERCVLFLPCTSGGCESPACSSLEELVCREEEVVVEEEEDEEESEEDEEEEEGAVVEDSSTGSTG